MEIPTREEYENEIGRLQGLIVKAQNNYNDVRRELDKSQSTCPGIRGWRVPGRLTECDAWKQDSANLWKQQAPGLNANIEQAKTNLWDYQKDVAKAEQDAQIKAVRQAIADQVRLEQERIQQSQQNQIIMQQAPPAEPPSEPSAIIEPGKPEPIATIEPGNNLTEANILRQNFKLPFHENYLIPLIAIGGYLVLRNN
jgi:predicted phosphohydrolase